MSARAQARLNQVVCTLEGMTALLQATPGDFAVVIHGDPDCVNVLVLGMDHPGAERFFCTGLSEAAAVAGRTREPLEACLEAVCRGDGAGREPGVVFVLGTCLTAVIGEDVRPVVERVSAATGVKVAALPGAGMRFVPQSTILDRFALLMLDACEPQPVRPGAVSLLGFHPGREVLDQLAALGVTVDAVLALGAPVGAWKRLPGAAVSLVLDPGLYPETLAQAERRFGVRPATVRFPVGARATTSFFAQVKEALDLDIDLAPVLGRAKAEARRIVEDARESLRGRRLGYNLGSKKNLDPRTLAREGLVDLALFEELGLDVTLLVQGDDRPARLDAVRETLAGFGYHADLEVFSDTVYFGELCRRVGVELVYASDHLREQARGAGVGFVEAGALRPGFGGVAPNVALVLEAAGGKP